MDGMGQVGARFLLIVTISICLVPGRNVARAEDAASTPTETLPAITVTAPATGVNPGRDRTPNRTALKLQRVFVYPIAPTPTAGMGIDVDRVPAGINAFGAAQIQRTGSLNIADT